MKSALSDFILGKKGIYGILHIIILLMSLFLVISISIDTFKGIPFYTQSSYMKIQLWICIWFLFDFVLEFFLAKHKWRYIRTHFIFLLVAIPYQNIIAYYGWTFSPEVTYLLRFIPLLRGGYALAIVVAVSYTHLEIFLLLAMFAHAWRATYVVSVTGISNICPITFSFLLIKCEAFLYSLLGSLPLFLMIGSR